MRSGRRCDVSQPRVSFTQALGSSVRGLWLRRGSASSLLDVVPGKRGAGVEGTARWGRLSFSRCLFSIRVAPGALFPDLSDCPERAGPSCTKFEAHMLGFSNMNDEEVLLVQTGARAAEEQQEPEPSCGLHRGQGGL